MATVLSKRVFQLYLAVQGVKRVVGICFKVVLKPPMNHKISFAPISDFNQLVS